MSTISANYDLTQRDPGDLSRCHREELADQLNENLHSASKLYPDAGVEDYEATYNGDGTYSVSLRVRIKSTDQLQHAAMVFMAAERWSR